MPIGLAREFPKDKDAWREAPEGSTVDGSLAAPANGRRLHAQSQRTQLAFYQERQGPFLPHPLVSLMQLERCLSHRRTRHADRLASQGFSRR